MRIQVLRGCVRERRFMFTRSDVEELLRERARRVADAIVPLPGERVVTVIELDTDGIDLIGEPLFTLTETVTELSEVSPAAEQAIGDTQ
jgi:hypothetical protein